MKDGWVKVYRKMQDKGFYKNSKYVHLWVHLLLKANHKPREVMWNRKTFMLQPGQFITGRKKLGVDTRISETSIERILSFLENGHQIGQQKTNKYRLITILKWERYQEDGQQNGQQADNKRTTNGQQADTDKKEDKNEKNERSKEKDMLGTKKSVPSSSKIIFSFQDKKFKGITNEDITLWSETYPACRIKSELLKMGDWLLSNPTKKKKNYRRFISNWLTRSQDKGGTKGIVDTPMERKPETPEEKSSRKKQEAEESEARYQKELEKWRGMSLEELHKHQVNLKKWGKIAKIPPTQVEQDLAGIIAEKEKIGERQ